jgi:CheY-like chemotaxis protein
LERSEPDGATLRSGVEKNKLAVILDDDAALAASISDLIKLELRWEVVAFTDPRAALSFVRHKLPELIVLDVLMPTIDGLQFYDYLKKDSATGTIPVLFISGVLGDEMTPLGIPNKIAFLRKPFDSDEFISEVKVLLGS